MPLLTVDQPDSPMQPVIPLLEASHVRRTADDGSLLFEDVSVTFPAGTSTAITGPPGSGKTLLLRALGLLDPLQGGEIRFRKETISDAEVPAFRRQVMLIAQRPGLIEGTVRDNLQLPFQFAGEGQRSYDEQRVIEWLSRVDRDTGFLDRRETDLSGGESQLVSLLRSLQLDPVALLLDEPTSSLDAATTAAVETLVHDWQSADAQRTLIVVSHTPSQVQRLATRVVSIERGRIVADQENAREPA